MPTVSSPLAGRVVAHCAAVESSVAAEDALLIVESMKMEIPVEAQVASVVVRYLVAVGEEVAEGQPVVELQ